MNCETSHSNNNTLRRAIKEVDEVTCRLVMVRRRASSESVAIGTTNGESGMCSSLNFMETS